jgi:hypothetical protein
MSYQIISLLTSLAWLVAIIWVPIFIFRRMHRASLDRNRLLFELKNEVRKLRKGMESGSTFDADTELDQQPNQPPQRNAGSRPSSGDSPASETPSSPGPRG